MMLLLNFLYLYVYESLKYAMLVINNDYGTQLLDCRTTKRSSEVHILRNYIETTTGSLWRQKY